MLNIFIPIIFFFVIFGGIIWLYIHNYKSTIQDIKYVGENGIKVPLVNSAYGYLWFNVHNGLYPRLFLFPGYLKITVLGTKDISFNKVKEIDLKTGFWYGGYCLIIKLNYSEFSYYLSMNRTNVKEVLKFLKSQNIALFERAQKLLNES